MRAPHLAAFYGIEFKRKKDVAQHHEDDDDENTSKQKRLRLRSIRRTDTDDDDDKSTTLPSISAEEAETASANTDAYDGASLLLMTTTAAAASSTTANAMDSPNDSDTHAPYHKLSPAMEQKMAEITTTKVPVSTDHCSFIESILKQHAVIVADTCKTFHSDPSAMQAALQAHQQCLESLLELYYKIQTHDSSADRANALFQENYKQLQQLHDAANSRSAGTMTTDRNSSKSFMAPPTNQLEASPSSTPFVFGAATAEGIQERPDAASKLAALSRPRQSTHATRSTTGHTSHNTVSSLDEFLALTRSPPAVAATKSNKKQAKQSTHPEIQSQQQQLKANEQTAARVRKSHASIFAAPTVNGGDCEPEQAATTTRSGRAQQTVMTSGDSDIRKEAIASFLNLDMGMAKSATTESYSTSNMEEEQETAQSLVPGNDKECGYRLDSDTDLPSQVPRRCRDSPAKEVPADPATPLDKENDPCVNNHCTPPYQDDDHKVDTGGWTCGECTLSNSPSKRRCEVCQARRPVSAKTSLAELPKRTPRGRRKRQQHLEEASQCLFGLPTNYNANPPAAGASDDKTPEMSNNLTLKKTVVSGSVEMINPTKRLATVADDCQEPSHDLNGISLATDTMRMEDGPRRITLDQGKNAWSQGQNDGTETTSSPSIESQETEDPASPAKMPTLHETATNASTATLGQMEATYKITSDKKIKAATKSGLVRNPYSAPWQSNAQSRRFDRELEVASAQANLARTGPIKTAGAAPEWHTAHRRPKAKRAEVDSDIWDESEHQEAYHEVVRGKARKNLPAHDCPECAAFYKTLIVTDSQPMDIREFCRHRSRSGPMPETPEGFWELDFADEIPAIRKAEAEERRAAALAAAAAKGKPTK